MDLDAPAAWKLFREAADLARAGAVDDAVEALNRLLAMFDPADDESRRLIAVAAFSKGNWFARAGRLEEAIAALDTAIERFAGSADAQIQELGARIRLLRVAVLEELGDFDAALAECDGLSLSLAEAEDSASRDIASGALSQEVHLLGRLQRFEEAERINRLLVERYAEAPELGVQTNVATASVRRSYHLLKARKYREAIRASDEVVERYRASSEVQVRAAVTRALVYRGTAHTKSLRLRGAFRNGKALMELIGPTPEPEIRDAVRESSSRAEWLFRSARLYNR